MNHRRYILSGFFIVSAVYLLGCSQVYNKLDPEPPMAHSSKDWPAAANFDAQADNATLTSMTISDIHFVAYRPQLNDLGLAHLASIASKLDLYGGEVTFDCQQVEAAVGRPAQTALRCRL